MAKRKTPRKVMSDWWTTFIAHLIINPALTRGSGIDFLQLSANVTNGEGGDFLDSVSLLYADLGLINTDNFGQMRNEIVNEGQTVSEFVFSVIDRHVLDGIEAQFVANKLITKTLEDEITQHPIDTVTITDKRDLETDPLIIKVYDDNLQLRIAQLTRLISELASYDEDE